MINFLIEYGKCRKNLITLPDRWEELVDLDTVTVHLTEIGAKQNLIVKGVQGLDIHLQSQGIPVNCYYMVVGKLLDNKDEL